MEEIWITCAEVQVESTDFPSGDTLGFMNIVAWATSEEMFLQKVRSYLKKYNWSILSCEETRTIDLSHNYGGEMESILDSILENKGSIGLGTFHSYPSKLN